MRRAAVAMAAVVLVVGGCGGAATPAGEGGPARFTVRGRWPDPSRIRVRLELETSPLPAAAFEQAVERAMGVWNDTGVVGFAFAAGGERADLSLGFRRGRHGACEPFGPSAAVAHTGFAPQPFVHFDAARDWSRPGPDGVSLFATALHELGHVLGLGHVDVDEAVMGSAVVRPVALSRHDRSGLHSLYGGGAAGAGDLQLKRGDGGVAVTLRAVAPPGCSAFACFDGDGDGRDEVVVWRTDAAGHGELMLFVFDATPRLVRTVGPFLGAVVPGARVGFATAVGGERLMVVVPTTRSGDPDAAIVRQFDGHGAPALPAAPTAAEVLAAATVRSSGDFDGDGVPECELRRAP